MPPPPPPPPYRDNHHYHPVQNEAKKPYDQLIIPPPMPIIDDANTDYPPDVNDRMHSASDIRPQLNGPDFSQPRSEPGFNSAPYTDKPRVQIKPYKFTFD